jgi:hypothetical protein
LRGGGLLAGQPGGLASYEALRLEASQDAGTLADWLIDNLPMPADERLRISVPPPNAQICCIECLVYSDWFAIRLTALTNHIENRLPKAASQSSTTFRQSPLKAVRAR